MSVRVRRSRKGWLEVDIRLKTADGAVVRERVKAPVASKSAAQRWGEARERELLGAVLRGEAGPGGKEVPTFREFAPRYLTGHVVANRLKPSSAAAVETILNLHVLPKLGSRRLDQVTSEDVADLKATLKERAPKTVNNVLTVLSKLLRVATDWKVIPTMPCAVSPVKVPKPDMRFLDFEELERLLEAARVVGDGADVAVLLGAEAGLRLGELVALEWRDLDFKRGRHGRVNVVRSVWQGHEPTSPKSDRGRSVPLTSRLSEALKAHRHIRAPLVLCQADGRALSVAAIRWLLGKAYRRANLTEGVHVLRHTFCSHLAMRGAAAKVIQELAGHSDLTTTMRYMHLARGAADDAIALLENGAAGGDMVETGERRQRKTGKGR